MANPIIISKQNIAGQDRIIKFTNKTFLNNVISQTAKTKIYQKTLQNISTDLPTHNSYLGTPVYDSLTIGELEEENKYVDLLGNEVKYTPLRFDEVLLDVSMVKNIVSTPIQGRNSTIKQYISDGDFNILVTGRISASWNGKNWEKKYGEYYPEMDIKWLVDICKAGYALPVTSNFLNSIFGIDLMVINDYRLVQSEGGRYSQVFELNCLSDKEVILEFTEEDVNDDETLASILNV